MKYELLDEDLQHSVSKMKIQIQQHHLDIIDGVPDHCLEIAIANYLYSQKNKENNISQDSKECDCV